VRLLTSSHGHSIACLRTTVYGLGLEAYLVPCLRSTICLHPPRCLQTSQLGCPCKPTCAPLLPLDGTFAQWPCPDHAKTTCAPSCRLKMANFRMAMHCPAKPARAPSLCSSDGQFLQVAMPGHANPARTVVDALGWKIFSKWPLPLQKNPEREPVLPPADGNFQSGHARPCKHTHTVVLLRMANFRRGHAPAHANPRAHRFFFVEAFDGNFSQVAMHLPENPHDALLLPPSDGPCPATSLVLRVANMPPSRSKYVLCGFWKKEHMS